MKKKKSREYSNVADMVRDLTDDKKQADEFEKHLKRRTISHFLFAQRSAAGLSQKDMADKMACSQSRISKLENGEDDDLRLGDLREYLDALDREMVMFIMEKPDSAADQIKLHAFMINRLLERLRKIAKEDRDISIGVSEFHWETLFNLTKMVIDGAKELPDFPNYFPSIIESMPEFEDCDEEPDGAVDDKHKAALH